MRLGAGLGAGAELGEGCSQEAGLGRGGTLLGDAAPPMGGATETAELAGGRDEGGKLGVHSGREI